MPSCIEIVGTLVFLCLYNGCILYSTPGFPGEQENVAEVPVHIHFIIFPFAFFSSFRYIMSVDDTMMVTIVLS